MRVRFLGVSTTILIKFTNVGLCFCFCCCFFSGCLLSFCASIYTCRWSWPQLSLEYVIYLLLATNIYYYIWLVWMFSVWRFSLVKCSILFACLWIPQWNSLAVYYAIEFVAFPPLSKCKIFFIWASHDSYWFWQLRWPYMPHTANVRISQLYFIWIHFSGKMELMHSAHMPIRLSCVMRFQTIADTMSKYCTRRY